MTSTLHICLIIIFDFLLLVSLYYTACYPGTKPTLAELLEFTCTDRRVINIPVKIGTKYVQFGTFLLNEENTRVKIMAFEHSNNAKHTNTEILKKWLTGRGRQPVTWATLVNVLRDVELFTLAGDIETAKCLVKPG